MYLHIGGDVTVSFREIVGVFDLKTAQDESTKEFLRMALEDGFVVTVGDPDAKKSFIVSNRNRVYYSPIASNTLRKRWMNLSFHAQENGP